MLCKFYMYYGNSTGTWWGGSTIVYKMILFSLQIVVQNRWNSKACTQAQHFFINAIFTSFWVIPMFRQTLRYWQNRLTFAAGLPIEIRLVALRYFNHIIIQKWWMVDSDIQNFAGLVMRASGLSGDRQNRWDPPGTLMTHICLWVDSNLDEFINRTMTKTTIWSSKIFLPQVETRPSSVN